jgi:hypothetical protein
MTETDNSAKRSILIVHGGDFKPPEEVYMDEASTALHAGVQRDFPDHVEAFGRVGIELAYYGDLGNAYLRSRGRHYDEQLDIGDRRNALDSLRKIPQRKKFGLQQYDKLRGKSAIPEAIADVASPLFGLLGLTPLLVSVVAKDFALYLRRNTDFTDQVRARVRDRLCELLRRGDKVMLMSHGTGCAVAYDVLWQLSHDERYRDEFKASKIEVFVTLGSPISDNMVRKRLLGARRRSKERYPTNIITWENVSAEDDYFCHDKTVANDLKAMMREHVISSINDYRVYNHALRYGKSNPHCSLGYFIHPRVAKIVVDWIGAPDAAVRSDAP